MSICTLKPNPAAYKDPPSTKRCPHKGELCDEDHEKMNPPGCAQHYFMSARRILRTTLRTSSPPKENQKLRGKTTFKLTSSICGRWQARARPLIMHTILGRKLLASCCCISQEMRYSARKPPGCNPNLTVSRQFVRRRNCSNLVRSSRQAKRSNSKQSLSKGRKDPFPPSPHRSRRTPFPALKNEIDKNLTSSTTEDPNLAGTD